MMILDKFNRCSRIARAGNLHRQRVLLVQRKSCNNDGDRNDAQKTRRNSLKSTSTTEFEKALEMILKPRKGVSQMWWNQCQCDNRKQRRISHRTQREQCEGTANGKFPKFSWPT